MAPVEHESEQPERQRTPQSEEPWHSTLLPAPTTNEQRAPRSQRSLASCSADSMQVEFSSQSAEHDSPHLPLQLAKAGHSHSQPSLVQGSPTKVPRSFPPLAPASIE